MNYSTKTKIMKLIDTINSATNLLKSMVDYNEGISACIDAYDMIQHKLSEYNENLEVINQIEEQKKAYKSFTIKSMRTNKKYIKQCILKNNNIKNTIEKDVICKIKLVFMPYKAAMWDSLASIYEAAKKDENCDTKVVPIPYYKYDIGEQQYVYEGDKLPDGVDIVDYNEYSLEEENPDAIFIHNIYDNSNILTQVKEDYFTWNLKKYTDNLIYVPYCLSSPIEVKDITKRVQFSSKSIQFVDKVVLDSEILEKEALNAGIPKDKFLTLGSPKFDDLYNKMKGDIKIPNEWQSILKDKKIILLNTGCLFFNNCVDPFSKLRLVFDIPRYLDNIAVIWRPHPLTREGINRTTPRYLDIYDDLCTKIKEKNPLYKNIILDQTADYEISTSISDMLITVARSSLLITYLLTDKPIMTLGDYTDEWLLPDGLLYDIDDCNMPWFEIAKKLSAGDDLIDKKRSQALGKIYKNIDGTSGQKIFAKINSEIINNL